MKPDVCILAENIADMSSSESVHDWFDVFRECCEEWKLGPKENDNLQGQKKKKSVNTSKMNENDDTNNKLKKNSIAGNNMVVGNKRGREIAESTTTTSLSSSSSSSLSLPISKNTKTSHPVKSQSLIDHDNDNDVIDDISQASTLQHRCRFAKVLHDLEKTDLIKVKHRGNVISRQIFTWIANE